MSEDSKNLVRELGLLEALTIGLGTMIGAGIFVLSALAARDTGPAAAITFAIAGLIILPSAFNISELVTAMPSDGGSYHLVSRALGPFAGAIVGPGNWIGLTFAAGFFILGFSEYTAYFLPIPEAVTTIVIGCVIILLNVFGAEVSGRVQMIIVSILVLVLGLFIVRGLLNIDPLLHEPFIPHGWEAVMTGVGLIIVSFTGFEEISTLAGEIKKPGRNLPLAIIGAVLSATLLTALTLYVATGVLPYEDLVSYQAPMVAVSERFMSGIGIAAMSVAALFATISSANASIITTSRINFAMGRDKVLPSWFGKVHSKFHTPHRSVIVSGVIAILLALSGQAEALAEIAATLYMITSAMLAVSVFVMRRGGAKKYQPAFKVPLYPFLTILGGLLAIMVIFTMETRSQIASLILIGISLGWYIVWGRRKSDVTGTLAPWFSREHPLEVLIEETEAVVRDSHHEILAVITDPETTPELLYLAEQLTKADPEGQIVAVNFVEVPRTLSLTMAKSHLDQLKVPHNEDTLETAERFLAEESVPGVVHQQPAYDIASGIIGLVDLRPDTKMLLLEWHGPLQHSFSGRRLVRKVVRNAECDVGVFLDRDLEKVRRILIPEDGGPHARMGLQIADALVPSGEGEIVLLRVISPDAEDEAEEVDALKHIIQEELDEMPEHIHPKLVRDDSVVNGVLMEAEKDYDLVVIGASEQWGLKNLIFGNKPDQIAKDAACSALLIRKWEPQPVSRVRRWLEEVQNKI